MLLSIIITLYNRKNLVGRCIKSISDLAQKDDVEVIIVDDGSTDEPLDILSAYIDNKNIHYHYKENGGPADAKNYGASLAEGKFIIFLDSDDYLINVEKLVSYIWGTQSQNYDFYYSSSVIIKKGESTIEDTAAGDMFLSDNIYNYTLAFPLHYPGKPTYVFNRKSFLLSGGFCKDFRWGDAMLFWRIFLKNASCCKIDFPSYIYDQSGSDSVSRNHDGRYYSNVYSTLFSTFSYIECELKKNKSHMNWVLVLCFLSLKCNDIVSFFKFIFMAVKEPLLSIQSIIMIVKNRRAK